MATDVLPEQAAEILRYWFDPGPEAKNYSTKWFPSPKSGHRETTDAYITEKFSALLKDVEEVRGWSSGAWEKEWCERPESYVAMLVLLDQFPRHVYRSEPDAVRLRNDGRAVGLAERFLDKGLHARVPAVLHATVSTELLHGAEPRARVARS